MDANEIAGEFEMGGTELVGPAVEVLTPPAMGGRPVAAGTANGDGLVADDGDDDTEPVTNEDGDEPEDEGVDEGEDDAEDDEEDDD